jgi:hypothetical protein
LAGKVDDFETINESEILSAISNKWLSTNSMSYFSFILKLAKAGFDIKVDNFNETEKRMLLMLHYDVWQTAGGFDSLEASIRAIGANQVMVDEIIELIELLIDRVDFKEFDIDLPYKQPLKVHARYTRDQIIAAFGFSTFNRKFPSREGVAFNEELNTELLFINLIKSEENFSPTTMYDDYAVTETQFHWQTQNSARPDRGKGLSYITHKEKGKRIMLFVREKPTDEFGNTMGYVFLGEATFIDSSDSQPMNINWRLHEPMPNYMWKDAAKLAVG